MKKIIIVALFLCQIVGFSQHKVANKIAEIIAVNSKFNHFSVFETNNVADSKIDKAVQNATLAKLKTSEINDIVTNKYEYLELKIPYNNQNIVIQLYKVDIFADGFHVDTDQSTNIAYQKGVYYRGIVKNDFASVVSFNFFKDECNGLISSNILKNIVVGKLNYQNNIQDYIIYKDTDLKTQNTFNCKTKSNPSSNKNKLNRTASPLSNRCVTFYFEIDYNLYQENNNNTTTTGNWMTSNFNNVQTIYTNDGITVALKSMFIWTNPDIYSTFGFTNSASYLYKFNEIRPVFDGDLGQLIGIDSGGLGGVAVGIDGLCTNNNFSYSDVFFEYENVPIYSWNTMVITHEFGHLMGSAHTHDCAWNGNETRIDDCGPESGNPGLGNCVDVGNLTPANGGTIMSYCHLTGSGIDFANGFGIQPATRILNKVNASTCLSTDCVNTCTNKILSSLVNNISRTSATITWTEEGGTQTSEVAIYPITATSGNFIAPTANSFTATNLLPNTYYKAVVRKLCSNGLIGPEITKIFVTDGDYCSGISLTDSGGSTANYLDYEAITRTIIPTDPNAKAKITFTAFDLELDYDYFQIFNGNNDTFPEISGFTFGYTGNEIPDPFQSTAIDGALTIKFTADGGVVNSGYEASISCVNLSNNYFEQALDFSYSPNPTHGIVTISSRTEISEILIYNPAGQLLFSDKTNNFKANVDISSYAKGTYFFKLKFAEKETNFKILKM